MKRIEVLNILLIIPVLTAYTNVFILLPCTPYYQTILHEITGSHLTTIILQQLCVLSLSLSLVFLRCVRIPFNFYAAAGFRSIQPFNKLPAVFLGYLDDDRVRKG